MYSAAQFVVAQNMIHPSTKRGNKITSMRPTKYNTAVLKGRTMSQSDKKSTVEKSLCAQPQVSERWLIPSNCQWRVHICKLLKKNVSSYCLSQSFLFQDTS